MAKPGPATRRLGLWATGLATVFSLAYTAGQVFEWLGLLGSHGGPNASSTALGTTVLLVPSLLLGPAWVITLAALDAVAPASGRGFSRAALALATVYAALTGLVYFVQLTFVGPRLSSGVCKGLSCCCLSLTDLSSSRLICGLQSDVCLGAVGGIRAACGVRAGPALVDPDRLADPGAGVADVRAAADLGRGDLGHFIPARDDFPVARVRRAATPIASLRL